MNKEFIPYEQALALKELGFDEPCFAWFILEGDGAKSRLVLEKCPKQDLGLCLAPLYQQAFRWFREKGLYYDIKMFGDLDKPQYSYIVLSRIENPAKMYYYEDKDSYEEAELACLNKLIQIIKTK